MQHPVAAEKRVDLERRMEALGIAKEDLQEHFIRGSGKGGQKINKTSSCVCLKHLPSGIVVKCQADRSRDLNRFLARRELVEALEAIRDGRRAKLIREVEKIRRQKRQRSRRSKLRSIADKRQLGLKKSLRKPPAAE
jgi:protein subunit release factor B